jgi:hypothetical protein
MNSSDITAEKNKISPYSRRKRSSSVLGRNECWNLGWNVQTEKLIFNRRCWKSWDIHSKRTGTHKHSNWIDLAHPDDLITSGEKLNACFEKKNQNSTTVNVR